MSICGIDLAAGKGTRMQSDLPKVLNEVNGKPMIFLSLDRLTKSNIDQTVVVVGFEAEKVKQAINEAGYDVQYAYQDQQLGTGHAVACGMKAIPDDCEIVVATYGDNPFIPTEIYNGLIEKVKSGAVGTISSIFFDDPIGPAFGRVVRDNTGKIIKIVEQKNCSDSELHIEECNGGPVAYNAMWLRGALTKIKKNNISGEYYLTDLVELATSEGKIIESVTIDNMDLAWGINTKEQLEKAGKIAAV